MNIIGTKFTLQSFRSTWIIKHWVAYWGRLEEIDLTLVDQSDGWTKYCRYKKSKVGTRTGAGFSWPFGSTSLTCWCLTKKRRRIVVESVNSEARQYSQFCLGERFPTTNQIQAKRTNKHHSVFAAKEKIHFQLPRTVAD